MKLKRIATILFLTLAFAGAARSQVSPSVLLGWSPSVTASVVKYNVYRAATIIAPWASIGMVTGPCPSTGCRFTDVNVVRGNTYYYAVASIDAANLEGPNSPSVSAAIPAAPPPPPATACPAPGTDKFTACFYTGLAFGTLLTSRTDAAINFDWGGGTPDPLVPPDGFSARWQGSFTLAAGTYKFDVQADDGVRLYVDGALLIDKWIDQAPTSYTASKALTAGAHAIKVEYFENSGGAVVKASWANVTPAPVQSISIPQCPWNNSIGGWRCDVIPVNVPRGQTATITATTGGKTATRTVTRP